MHLSASSRTWGKPASPARGRSAITLLELLVVIGILGIMAAISLPAMKGLGENSTISSAVQQLTDDVALARRMAINSRCKVSILFMGPAEGAAPAGLTPAGIASLVTRQFTGYLIYAERSVGDQPGQNTPRYLTSWRTLPDGMVIAEDKFRRDTAIQVNGITRPVRMFDMTDVRYPKVDGASRVQFCSITFGPSGDLISTVSADNDCIIPLARGSIFIESDTANPLWSPAKPMERPPRNSVETPNLIVIDAPTGRVRLEKNELQ